MYEPPQNKMVRPVCGTRECVQCGSGRTREIDSPQGVSVHCRECGHAVLTDRRGETLTRTDRASA